MKVHTSTKNTDSKRSFFYFCDSFVGGLPSCWFSGKIRDRLVKGVEVPRPSNLDKEVTLSSTFSLEALSLLGFVILPSKSPSFSSNHFFSGRVLVAFFIVYMFFYIMFLPTFHCVLCSASHRS